MNRLKELRTKHDRTQQDVADYLNITQRAVSNYELGKRDIPNDILKKLADYYHVTTDEILGHEPLKRGLLGDLDKKAIQNGILPPQDIGRNGSNSKEYCPPSSKRRRKEKARNAYSRAWNDCRRYPH